MKTRTTVPSFDVLKAQLKSSGFSDPRQYTSAAHAVKRVLEIYAKSAGRARTAAQMLSDGHTLEEVVIEGNNYPAVIFRIGREQPAVPNTQVAHICRNGEGWYVLDITRPQSCEHWLRRQILSVMESHDVPVIIARGLTQIPLESVMDTSGLAPEIAVHFASMDPVRVERSNFFDIQGAPCFPLLETSGLQRDYHEARLAYYTGTPVDHFQSYVLLTNYDAYVKAFLQFGQQKVAQRNSGYSQLIIPQALNGNGKKMPQMPAYHLVRKDGQGITLVNIGVGPSNALNMTSKLCVLQPLRRGIVMVGHAGGLHVNQRIGMFCLADTYFRRDLVLDRKLPLDIPITPVSEWNQALRDGVAKACRIKTRDGLKAVLESGTVASVAQRDWEGDDPLREEFLRSRARVVDMESATIAATCFLHRVPFATLLRISDIPTWGQLKLSQYEDTIAVHLLAAIHACEKMRRFEYGDPSSRKHQAADSPAFLA